MSKTWKWILGIALGLIILAGLGFLAANFYWFGPMTPRGGSAFYGPPMMGGRGFYPLGGFFFLGGLLRWLFPLTILLLVGYFAYQKGKKGGAAEASASTPQV